MDCKANNKSDINDALVEEFLDFKINERLPKFREEHKEEYKVIINLMQLFNSLKDKFVGKNASEQDIFLLSSIIELNKLFQSAVLLFERGIPSSANIIVRTILELSLNIVETVKNKEHIQEIMLNEIKETRSTVNIAKEFTAGLLLLRVVNRENLRQLRLHLHDCFRSKFKKPMIGYQIISLQRKPV